MNRFDINGDYKSQKEINENQNVALYLEDKSLVNFSKGEVIISHGNIQVEDNKEAIIRFSLSKEFIPDDLNDLKNHFMLTLGRNEEEGIKQLPKGNVKYEYSDIDLVKKEGTKYVFNLYQKINAHGGIFHICNVNIPNAKVDSFFDGIKLKNE